MFEYFIYIPRARYLKFLTSSQENLISKHKNMELLVEAVITKD